jgi:hypothetical protein
MTTPTAAGRLSRSPLVQFLVKKAPVIAIIFAGCFGCSLSQQEGPKIDISKMEAVEELTESLANHLLELSVAARQKDRESIAAFFAVSLSSPPFPSTPGDEKKTIKWFSEHDWKLESANPGPTGRRAYLESFNAFLDHFQSIEDARFKVKSSSVAEDGKTVTGSLKIFVVGRDRKGRREWMRGLADFQAHPLSDEKWQITALTVTEISSQIAGEALFEEVGGPLGFTASNPPFLDLPKFGYLYHGASVADLNNDGFLDLFSPGFDRNYLYLNRGDGTFQEAAAGTGLKVTPEVGLSALFLDYDKDGDTDLFLATLGKQMLFQNRLVPDGELYFLDVSEQAGISVQSYGMSSAAADVNRDGWPDIYLTSFNEHEKIEREYVISSNELEEIKSEPWVGAFNGTPNLLFINQGNGKFTEAGAKWGVDDTRWALAASFADLDNDGDQDLYVANDFAGGSNLYWNQLVQGEERFIEASPEQGVLDIGNGMGVSFGDYDNDGDLDLHVTNMSSIAGNRILERLFSDESASGSLLKKRAAGNHLYENLGNGRFRDRSTEAGPFVAGWAWGGGFIDFDNDGREDLYTPNGMFSGKTMNDT